MENQGNDNSIFKISFNENAKQSLRAAAIVAGIASLVTLVRAIIFLTSFFVNRARTKTVQIDEYITEVQQPEDNNSLLRLIVSILVFLVMVLLFYFLNRFSIRVKNGVDNTDPLEVNGGFKALAYYFKTIGILFIIIASLTILGLLMYAISQIYTAHNPTVYFTER